MYAVTSASRCAHKIVGKLTSTFDVRANVVTDLDGMNVFHIALQNEDCDLELVQLLVRKYVVFYGFIKLLARGISLEHQHRYTREHDEYSIMNRRTRESKNVQAGYATTALRNHKRRYGIGRCACERRSHRYGG